MSRKDGGIVKTMVVEHVAEAVNITMDLDAENETGASDRAIPLQGLPLMSYFFQLDFTSRAS